MKEKDANIKFLELLAKDFPNIRAAAAEIINLNAILALPKGTEYFLSDLHGEHEAFVHMIKSASGVIASKIEEIFGGNLAQWEMDELASLIYNSKAEIKRQKKKLTKEEFDSWCSDAIYRLIEVCQSVSTKYTRKKVRKALPEYSAYSIDELLHADDEENKVRYYSEIIHSVVQCGVAEPYIEELADSISRLAVDKLHIIGDIFDRGAHPDRIMDYLLTFREVDFQWGNHDIVWMGAASGNLPCIANILRLNISYNNFDMLEIGYGINLRPLSSFAQNVYKDDPCEFFKPHVLDKNVYDSVSEQTASKMNKAIAIIQFKLEGQCIKNHPEFGMDDRLLLDKIDFEKGTVMIGDTEWELRDKNFPTIDPKDPYKLTEVEESIMGRIQASILNSEKLQRHIRYLFSKGAMYTVINKNLLYHGCIPMTEDGYFQEWNIYGKQYKGKALMDFLDDQVRKAYFSPEECVMTEHGHPGDLMWYMWLGGKSPLFGKDRMTTFERCFIADKKTHKEHTSAYYKLRDRRDTCEKILAEFGLDPATGHILNGHVPVKLKDGESPIKGKGKLLVIDGGMSKAYQKQTGIAGYTFIFNSRFMALAEHKPYTPIQEDGSQEFHAPVIHKVETLKQRMTVRMSDQGQELVQQTEDLKALIDAFRRGLIKEQY